MWFFYLTPPTPSPISIPPTCLITPSSSTATLPNITQHSPAKSLRRRLTWRNITDRTRAIKVSFSPKKKIDKDWEWLDLQNWQPPSGTPSAQKTIRQRNEWELEEERCRLENIFETTYQPLPLSSTPPSTPTSPYYTSASTSRSTSTNKKLERADRSLSTTSFTSYTRSNPTPKTRFDAEGRRVLVSMRQRRRSELSILNSLSTGNLEDYAYMMQYGEAGTEPQHPPVRVKRVKKKFGIGDEEDSEEEELSTTTTSPETKHDSLFENSSNSTCASTSEGAGSATSATPKASTRPSLLRTTSSSTSCHSPSNSPLSLSPPKFSNTKRSSTTPLQTLKKTPSLDYFNPARNFLRRRSTTAIRNNHNIEIKPPQVSSMKRSSSGPILTTLSHGNSLELESEVRSHKSPWRHEYRIESRGELKITNPDIPPRIPTPPPLFASSSQYHQPQDYPPILLIPPPSSPPTPILSQAFVGWAL